MVTNENRLHTIYNNINGYLRYEESRNGVFLGLLSFATVLATDINYFNFMPRIIVFIPIIAAAMIIVISFMPISELFTKRRNERYKRGNKRIKNGIKENILDPKFIAKLDTKLDKDRFFERLGINGVPEDDHYLDYLFNHSIVTARKVRFKSVMFMAALYCVLLYIPMGLLLIMMK